ncbi:MAG: hypothetical protein LZF86_80010 [Nitrospira sp.]|nr:MAG: hypothetical protein LZF86_80010 [Nitrospira sp.]
MNDDAKQPEEHWSLWWLRTGKFHEWFGWIEALTLTSVFASATFKVNQPLLRMVLGAITVISAWNAFHWGVAGLSRFMSAQLAFQRIPRRARASLAWIIGTGASIVVFLSLIPVFLSLLG